MSQRVAIIGAGDLGRTLAQQLSEVPELTLSGWFDDTLLGQSVSGVEVLGSVDDAERAHAAGEFDAVLLGIGYKHLGARASIFARLKAAGVPFATLVHPSCTLAQSAQVGEGAVLFPGCTLDQGAKVGENSLLNTGCVIAHDSTIGAHTFLGPGVTLAGFISVGERCFLGVGTVVIDNLTLHHGSQTGGGAVVTRDVPEDTLVVGVPARPLRRLSQ